MRENNNLNINISQYLDLKYPGWNFSYQEIYQLDESFEIIKEWKNKRDITNYFQKKVQGLDLALRESCRFQGYHWVWKVLYDKDGLRPILKEKRNTPIYAYDPPKEILDNIQNYSILDISKGLFKNKFKLIGRFNNSVLAGEFLDLSITNIRRVAKQEILFHKEYYFTFQPLLLIHKLTADIIELSNKNNKDNIKEDEANLLLNTIEEFKKIYTEDNRVVSSAEKQLAKILIT